MNKAVVVLHLCELLPELEAVVWMLFGRLIHGGLLMQTLWIQHQHWLLLLNTFCWEYF